MAISAPFLVPALRKHCLPYVPATSEQIVNIFRALNGRKGTLLDIGSGDGRIVFGEFRTTSGCYIDYGCVSEAAKRGFVAHGVELNPWLVLYSKLQALKFGYRKEVRFFRKDLWKFNFSPYDNVVIFGVEEMVCSFVDLF